MNKIALSPENIGSKTKAFLSKGFRSFTSKDFRNENPAWGMTASLSTVFALTIGSMYTFNLIPYQHITPELMQDPPSINLSFSATNYSIEIPDDRVIDRVMRELAIGDMDESEPHFQRLDVPDMAYFANLVTESLKQESFTVPDVTHEDFGLANYSISESSLGAIFAASDRTGVGVGLLLAMASKESGFRETVSSASGGSAQGLFQFTAGTWTGVMHQLGDQYGYQFAASQIRQDQNGRYYIPDPELRASILSMRDNPYHSSLMSAALLIDNIDRMEKSLGREINNTEKYLSHFLGVGDAIYFLRRLAANPNSYPSSHSTFANPIRYNRNIFFDQSTGRERTFRQVYETIRADFEPRVAYYALMYGDINTSEHDFAREYIVDNHIVEASFDLGLARN